MRFRLSSAAFIAFVPLAGMAAVFAACGGDSNVERGIIESTLRTLHPVNNTAAVSIGSAFATNGYTRVADEVVKRPCRGSVQVGLSLE